MNANGKQSLRINGNFPKIIFFVIIFLFVLYFFRSGSVQPVKAENYIWGVRSIDTMKTSRDMALSELNNTAYDAVIEKQLALIKDIGANYVAIDTPYDNEFLPYLKRWVSLARQEGLSVWFRGSFSNYEGWFNYPKNLSPDNLLTKTQKFIATNPDLFKDGDIFDPCPECENGGFWPQNQGNSSYNKFMEKKNDILKASFASINKKVIYNWNSVIGGRAKDVLTKDTFNYLGKVVALDHYVPDAKNYGDYINYFWNSFGTKTIFSEFGAPVPDIHGNMNSSQQANFINQVLQELYKNKNNVPGLNYWVLTGGTTALYNPDFTPRKVVDVVKNYYEPAIIKGVIKDKSGNLLKNIQVKTSDGANSVYSDSNGNYQLAVPAGNSFSYETLNDNYFTQNQTISSLSQNQIFTHNFTLQPKASDIFSMFRLYFQRFFN